MLKAIGQRVRDPRYRPGKRVKLLPFEDQPEQKGHILNWPTNDVIAVEIDVQYRDADGTDDGLREVPLNQIEVLS